VAADLFLRLELNLLLLLGYWSNLFGGRRPRALRRDLERGAAQRSGRLSPRIMAGATGGGAPLVTADLRLYLSSNTASMQTIWMTRAHSASPSRLCALDECQTGVPAISEMPLLGSRAAAISCWREAPTRVLEAVPKAFLSRCHHSRACPAGG
jgi:hypothetical protein